MANWADRLAKLAQALATAGTVPDTSISTAETDVDLRLAPDGAGGVEWGAGGATPEAASYKRTSADYTTTSTTFVDVDATNFALTITTGARRCLVGFVGAISNSGASTNDLDIDIDGVRQGADAGLTRIRTPTAAYRDNASFTFLTAALTAASHTFKLKWKVAAGTGTIHASSTDSAAEFWVMEVA